MEMNPVCCDRAMRSAAGGLGVAQARPATSPNDSHAKAANEFTSLHRSFSHSTVRGLQKSRTEFCSPAFIACYLLAKFGGARWQYTTKLERTRGSTSLLIQPDVVIL